MIAFESFKKIPILSRDMVITEKIDGTNAQIFIAKEDSSILDSENNILARKDGYAILAGSRNKWLSTSKGDDNLGFAKWVSDNADELFVLGDGRHYGEWWGQGIQRGYGIKEKRFSLFNTKRWADKESRPSCCYVVPILYQGLFDTEEINKHLILLKQNGSVASPGLSRPEGIVIYHATAGIYFKKTIEKDEKHKGEL